MAARKKKTNPSAPPEKPVNVDWDKINAKYWATVDKWIEQGIDVPATRQRKAMLEEQATREQAREAGKQRPSRAKPKGTGGGRGSKPQFDAEVIVERYRRGDFVRDIAKDMGCAVQTVVNYLKKAEVYEPGRDSDRQRRRTGKDECHRGHDMTVHGRPIFRQGPGGVQLPNGRYCNECRRMRGRGDI